jgi:hypothetical protein
MPVEYVKSHAKGKKIDLQDAEAARLTLCAKSDTIHATQYSLNRWSALVYYCRDGQTGIDNLIVERVLRGLSTGGATIRSSTLTRGTSAPKRCTY